MRDSETDAISQSLLMWYDVHARKMPWRISPHERKTGIRPDPYRVWLSEVMLQQTTVAAVTSYFERFTTRWPGVRDLAGAKDADVMGEWAGLGYYARARNLLKCARVVTDELGGTFPDTYDDLLKLPGIGPYTAAAISAIAFDRPETVLDGNVERVMARLHNIHDPLPGSKPLLRMHATAHTPDLRAGDYAQAVMDLGATICTPKSAACGICPIRTPCEARIEGTVAELPRKIPKKMKPTRYGWVYLARLPDGSFVLERRPDKGLLGGMLGWPGSDWSETPDDAPPFDAEWQDIPGEVRHTFTHFHLILKLRYAQPQADDVPDIYEITDKHQFRANTLPTVMKKAYTHWRGQ